MGKYGEALGIWELKIGGADFKLHPKKGDNFKLINLATQAKKYDENWLLDQYAKFIKEVISRDYPPLNEQEVLELEEYIEFNLMELFKETQIAFRIAKREDIEKRQAELTKKLMGAQ